MGVYLGTNAVNVLGGQLPAGEQYSGAYEVAPKMQAQTLVTNGKTLSDDIVVRDIPVTITSNEQGGNTVLIG